MTRFTPQDIAYIKSIGHTDDDIPQIKEAVRYTTYDLDGKKISCDEAIRLLSKEKWIAGICRSAFHWSAAQQTDDGKEVGFDTSRMFKARRH